jgi:hypothetical protein
MPVIARSVEKITDGVFAHRTIIVSGAREDEGSTAG